MARKEKYTAKELHINKSSVSTVRGICGFQKRWNAAPRIDSQQKALSPDFSFPPFGQPLTTRLHT